MIETPRCSPVCANLRSTPSFSGSVAQLTEAEVIGTGASYATIHIRRAAAAGQRQRAHGALSRARPDGRTPTVRPRLRAV